MMNIRSYSELIQHDSFIDRFNYLKLNGNVGTATFGFDRYLNQALYKSKEWKRTRNNVLLRDNVCDLGIDGREIFDKRYIMIHHMNPITPEMVENRDPVVFDPEFLITTIHRTHMAIHYGDSSILLQEPIIRTANDTCPWRI